MKRFIVFLIAFAVFLSWACPAFSEFDPGQAAEETGTAATSDTDIIFEANCQRFTNHALMVYDNSASTGTITVYIWDGGEYQALSGTIDLSAPVPKVFTWPGPIKIKLDPASADDVFSVIWKGWN